MLIIFSGLPATGKTTVAKQLASQIQGTYLRIDTIEHTLKTKANLSEVGGLGYEVAYALAKDNLILGQSVIADSVNPIKLTRSSWRKVALDIGSPFIEVEIICSDKKEHQQRVENRLIDIQNFHAPTWQDIINRQFEPWTQKRLVIDTALISVEKAVFLILSAINADEIADKKQ